MEVSNVAPATPHPMGPAIARKALPAAIAPPPAANAPPPSQAIAAFVAAAPDSVEIAAPVEAVPKVVAPHMAADGAMLATAMPAAPPAPALAAEFRAESSSSRAKDSDSLKLRFLRDTSSISSTNDFGVFAIEFTRSVTRSSRSMLLSLDW